MMPKFSVTPSKYSEDGRQMSTMAIQRQTVDRGVTMFLLAALEAFARQIR